MAAGRTVPAFQTMLAGENKSNSVARGCLMSNKIPAEINFQKVVLKKFLKMLSSLDFTCEMT